MSKPVTTDEKQDSRFKPGRSGNPKGRPKGSRHKLSEAFIAAMCQDFEEHGAAVIEQVRTEKPEVYIKVIASLLPKDINVRTDPFEGMTDDQLRQRVDETMKSLQDYGFEMPDITTLQ